MTKLQSYHELVEIREKDVEGTVGTESFHENEDKWLWIKGDSGAWDGPARDWAAEHRHKYFKYLKKKDVVITAGANQGMYVRFFAKSFGTVYAFEPDPLNFHCMAVNNQCDNVVKMNAALGEEPGFCFIQRNGFENTGTWSINEGADGSRGKGRCLVMTIDSFNFETVDLIQLDTEGYEGRILRGAKNTIKRCRPVVVAENGHNADVTDFMKSIDYKEACRSVADTVFIPKDMPL